MSRKETAIGPVKAVAFVVAAIATIITSIAMPTGVKAADALENADDAIGLYGSMRTGKAWIGNMHYDNPVVAELDLDADSAGSFGGSIGYRFAGPFRADVNIDYLDADFDGRYREFTVITIPCGESPGTPCLGPGVDGDLSALSAFAMGYYDMDVMDKLTAHVGAGLGMIRQGIDVATAARFNNGTSEIFSIIDDNDTTVGYRLAAGVGYDVGVATIDVGYSFTTASRSSFAATGSGIPGFDLEPRLKSHSIDLALRFNL